MAADMIPDEALVEEILEEMDTDDDSDEVDFAEGGKLDSQGLELSTQLWTLS